MPAPTLVSPPMPDIVPANVVLVLSLPVVSVAEPSVTLPAPASEPMVWLKLARSSVAPPATVNALPADNAFAAPACSVPALTAVAPEYVLLPESVNVPAPTLVSPPPTPDIVPANVVLVLSLPVVSVAEPSVTLPAPASEPMVWLKPARSSVALPATVNALPDAKALAAPACSVPALTAVAPE